MLIPNLERAVIDPRKLVDYLLATDHPEGAFWLKVRRRRIIGGARWPKTNAAKRLADPSRRGLSEIGDRLSLGAFVKLAELSRVVLTRDVPEETLSAGDVGTIVHAHPNGAAYEVEFFTLTGKTIAVATIVADALRPVAANDVASARTVAAE